METMSGTVDDRFTPRAEAALAGSAFWFCLFAASALGTNLGDFCADLLSPGRAASFAVLSLIALLAIGCDRAAVRPTAAGYWVAIVVLRAAATNIGDFMTHDLRFDYRAATLIFGAITLFAASFTRARTSGAATPRVDGRYWAAMLMAGIFGTVGGDLASRTFGLFAAVAVLCVLLLLVLAARRRMAPTSILAYWCAVLVERCAGTPMGDVLASHHGLGLGLPVAMGCTGDMLLGGLLILGLRQARP